MRGYGKDSPYRRRSSSQSHQDREIQQQRSRQKISKVQYYMGPDLHLTKHYYFLMKDEKGMSISIAVWNLCILYAKRPGLCLVVCDNESQMYKLKQFNKLNRKALILPDHDCTPLKTLIGKQSVQILLITNKKLSMLCENEETINSFTLVINLSFHRDIDHYRKLHEFIQKSGGVAVSFVNERRELEKIQRSSSLNFLETTAQITAEDLHKEIIGDIQFVPTPKPETFSLLKLLPYSSQQISARLFQILQSQATDISRSKYLGLVGYVTYQIQTQVQFNSYKYIWNFLKDLPEQLIESVKSMTKFKNWKGAVFNIPVHLKYEMDHFVRKISKHKDNKFDISLVDQLPEIEDVDSPEYKIMEEKKNYAMKNRRDLQVFVGGLPTKASQQEIRDFFLKNNVNPLTIRIMKDKNGISKGICFILCEDREHMLRALKLDEIQFQDKIIRVHVAEKKEPRWDN